MVQRIENDFLWHAEHSTACHTRMLHMKKTKQTKKNCWGLSSCSKARTAQIFTIFLTSFASLVFNLPLKKNKKNPRESPQFLKTRVLPSQSVLFQSVGDCCRLTSRLGMALSQLNVPTLKDRPQLRVTRLHQPMPPSTQVENTRPYKAFNQETL